MKQYITPEQLNELSEKGKERLRGRIHQKWQDEAEALEPMVFVTTASPQDRDLLLSIGQMIEFLDEKNYLEIIDYGGVNIGGYQNKWRVECENSQISDNELCDALWEACKQVLEE